MNLLRNAAPILRVGVIGCGGVAQMMHLPHLHKHDDRFEIAALADLHAPTLAAVAAHFSVAQANTTPHWRELLQRDDIDAVLILHNGSHYETVMAALDAGKHIFVEKPVGWNLRQVEAIAERAKSGDRILQIGYHKLYDPGFVVARDAIRDMRDLGFVRVTVLHPDDALGWTQHRVRRGEGVFTEGWHDPGTPAEQVARQLASMTGGALAPLVDEALGARSNQARLRLAYGIMASSLIHQVYTLHGLLGELPVVRHTDIWRDGLSIHVVAEARGVPVTLDWHFLSHLKDYREEYACFGHHDRVTFTLPSPYARHFPSPVTVQGHEGELVWEKQITVSYEEAFELELLAFHDNITRNTMPMSNIDAAVQHHRFIQAMIDAAM